jgi:hypothetical protein
LTAPGAAGGAYRARADVRFRRIEDEAVVLRQAAGEVLVLNGIGARVLELLAAGAGPDEAARRLAEEFEVDLAEAAADVRSFAAELGAAGVLEPAPPERSGERP